MTASDAQIYFKKAKEDIVVIAKLVNDLDVSDASWGFHAHQAIEKMLKAFLAKMQIEFPKSHDLVFLYELLPSDTRVDFTTIESDCENLNPFAVTLRYDDSLEETLDRPQILARIIVFQRMIETELGK
jgi:HEPN domain-containing protein